MKNEKFDKQIKANLENRRIEPSVSGWGKLSANLDKAERKNRKPLWWSGIAAVFLLGVFIGGLVFNQNEVNPEKVETAGSPSNIEIENEIENEIQIETPAISKEKPKEEVLLVTAEKDKQPETTSPVKGGKNRENKPGKLVKKQNPDVDELPVLPKAGPAALVQSDDTILFKQEANKIIQKVMEKTQVAKVTNAEIEKLLRQARAEIESQPQFVWDENQIDAQALLESVERELNPSYKEKLFRFVEDKLIQLASTTGAF